MADPARNYVPATMYPTEGTMNARQFERQLQTSRTTWDKWAEIVMKNGPTDIESQKMLLQVGTEIAYLERIRSVYFCWSEENPDTED